MHECMLSSARRPIGWHHRMKAELQDKTTCSLQRHRLLLLRLPWMSPAIGERHADAARTNDLNNVGDPEQTFVPAQSILQWPRHGSQRRHCEVDSRGVQNRPGCAAWGWSTGAALCELAVGRRQRPVRRTARPVAHRVRSGTLPQSDGHFQLCGRRNAARLCRFEA